MKGCLVLAALAAFSGMARAEWVQWSGNDHWYNVVRNDFADRSWGACRIRAQKMVAPDGSSGDLATIGSAEENAFVFSLVDKPEYWYIDGAFNNEGPFLGGLQYGSLEPAGGWAWANGEPWIYTNWHAGEPNNNGGHEDFLCFFAWGSARSDKWNDISTSTADEHLAYVVEGIPDPQLTGTVGLLDYTGSRQGWTVALWLYDALGALVYTKSAVLDAEGSFKVASYLPDGTYKMRVKSSHWLARSSSPFTLSSGAGHVMVQLTNGDVDGDNAVTVFDYNVLSAAFDTAVGDPAWDAEADLDGDDAVTVFDYNILSQNFDLVGD